jgi:hypothetical protein
VSNCTVVRVRPLGYDDNGDPIAGEPNRLAIDGCAVAPRSTSDITDRGRHGVIVGLSLFTPYGADIVHSDLLEVDGVTYEVDGEAGPWKSPFTQWEAGMEIALKRAAG